MRKECSSAPSLTTRRVADPSCETGDPPPRIWLLTLLDGVSLAWQNHSPLASYAVLQNLMSYHSVFSPAGFAHLLGDLGWCFQHRRSIL